MQIYSEEYSLSQVMKDAFSTIHFLLTFKMDKNGTHQVFLFTSVSGTV